MKFNLLMALLLFFNIYASAQQLAVINIKGNPALECGVVRVDADDIETGKFTDNGPVITEDTKYCGARIKI